jgi:hypothetical protein
MAAPTNVRSWELNGLKADSRFWAVHDPTTDLGPANRLQNARDTR